jgi:hypothetical protein
MEEEEEEQVDENIEELQAADLSYGLTDDAPGSACERRGFVKNGVQSRPT